MVIEPFVRMGPPPRSLAAEANDCFMVRLPRGATEYKVAARSSRAMAGSPRIVGEQPGHRGAAAAPKDVAVEKPPRDGNTIPLRNGEQSMPTGLAKCSGREKRRLRASHGQPMR